ncbi:MAG: hypothetical protein Kow0025_08730 [Thermodesulfovibrionales bacterium]
MSIEARFAPPGGRLEKAGDYEASIIARALSEGIGNDYSGVWFVAPTRRKVQNWTRAFQRRAGKCYVPPVALTLKQLAGELYGAYGDKAVLEESLRPVLISGISQGGMGLARVLADFIAEMKDQFPLQAHSSLTEVLDSAFSELGIPDEAAARARSALEVFRGYDELLAANGLVDTRDAMAGAARMADNLDIRLLILDGFYEITPLEELLIAALIGRARNTLATIPVSGPDDDLTHCYSNFLERAFGVRTEFLAGREKPPQMEYHPARSMEEEVEAIARQIKASFISGRLRELEESYVVFPSLEPYRETVRRVFGRYGIPHDISPERPRSETRPFRDLLAILEAVAGDYPRLAMGRVLTSPTLEKVPPEIRAAAPGLCLSAGIIKGRDSWLRAFEAQGLAEQAKKFFKALSPLEKIINNASYGEYVEAFLKAAHGLGLVLPADERAELERALGRLGLMDEVLGKGVDLAVFSEAARGVLSDLPKGPEAPGVRVAGLYDVRGLEPGMLYFGGLKDGDIPRRPEMDLLLPDSVRKRLGLMDMARNLRLQEHIFRRITGAARGLYLSYPTMDGDKFFLPSVFLAGGREAGGGVYGIFSREEEQLRRPSPPLHAHIREISGMAGHGYGQAMSITDIDAYRSCPRRFFIERVLCLEPPEIKEYEVEPKVIGTVTHKVMEELIGGWTGEGPEAFRERAAAAMDRALAAEPMEDYFKGLLKESFLAVVGEIYGLEEDIRAGGYGFRQAEVKVEGEPLRGIRLKGKIDRIDSMAGDERSVQVIDYKTGGADLSATQVLRRGKSLQLFLYAALLRAMGLEPRRVGIYSLKDLRLKWIPGRSDCRKGVSLDEYISAALRFLEETVARLREGDFTALPLEEQTCRNCHERPYCPYIQGAGRERAEGGDGKRR